MLRIVHDHRVEREKGIEPSLIAWKAIVLPLNYSRMTSIIPVFGIPVKQKDVYSVDFFSLCLSLACWCRATSKLCRSNPKNSLNRVNSSGDKFFDITIDTVLASAINSVALSIT